MCTHLSSLEQKRKKGNGKGREGERRERTSPILYPFFSHFKLLGPTLPFMDLQLQEVGMHTTRDLNTHEHVPSTSSSFVHTQTRCYSYELRLIILYDVGTVRAIY